jgi:hypothetical protein
VNENDTDSTAAPTRRDSRERGRAGRRRGSERSERSRREYVKYGGAVVTGGRLAGCVGESDGESVRKTTGTVTSTQPTTEDTGEV